LYTLHSGRWFVKNEPPPNLVEIGWSSVATTHSLVLSVDERLALGPWLVAFLRPIQLNDLLGLFAVTCKPHDSDISIVNTPSLSEVNAINDASKFTFHK